MARYLTRLHSLEALDFWKELSKKTSLTRLDVRDEAMIAIIAGDIALADTAMDELIDSRAEPADWLLATQLAIQKNLPDEAKSYLEFLATRARQKANSSGQRCCNYRLRPAARASGQPLLHVWEN